MGIVETLVHTHDLAAGLGLDWTPPAELCARTLARLFPDAPEDADPWTALLWCTGRAELPARDAGWPVEPGRGPRRPAFRRRSGPVPRGGPRGSGAVIPGITRRGLTRRSLAA